MDQSSLESAVGIGSQEPTPARVRVALMAVSMGYGTELLYWEPLLRRFFNMIRDLRIMCLQPGLAERYPDLPFVSSPASLRIATPVRRGHYRWVTHLPSPSAILWVWRFRPDVIIVSEFSLLTVYGVVASRRRPKCGILLLVESDPGPTMASFFGWRRRLRRFICRNSDLILTNNERGRRYLEHDLGVPERKIMQAPYLVAAPPLARGVPSQRDRRQGHSVDGLNECAFLFIGRLIQGKGVIHLLRAFAAAAALSCPACRLVIVGDGPERPQLEALTEELGLKQRVTFTGWVAYEHIAEYYDGADVFVSPTLQDYRSLVAFEARAFGLPLLISQFDGASSEVVIPGENGFLFDPTDYSDCAMKLVWFAQHPDARKAFSHRSSQLAAHDTVESAVENLVTAVKRCATPAS